MLDMRRREFITRNTTPQDSGSRHRPPGSACELADDEPSVARNAPQVLGTGKGCCGAYRHDDHRYLSPHQVRRQVRETAVVPVSPAKLDRDVATLDIAGVGEPVSERRGVINGGLGRTWMEKADDRHRGLLRACRERPRRRPAEERDEIAPSQFIKSHSIPASQSRIAGYRIGEEQSAGFGPLASLLAN